MFIYVYESVVYFPGHCHYHCRHLSNNIITRPTYAPDKLPLSICPKSEDESRRAGKKILKERLYVSLNPLLGEKVRLYAVA